MVAERGGGSIRSSGGVDPLFCSVLGQSGNRGETELVGVIFMGLRKKWRMENWRTALHNNFAGLQTRRWRMHEQRLAITFMGLRKKVENGELVNNATQ